MVEYGDPRAILFRPSRPDFIETGAHIGTHCDLCWYCSGLLGRTSLRRSRASRVRAGRDELFRPSRPDFIETLGACGSMSALKSNCSGLLGRTSLRHELGEVGDVVDDGLFRPSRPDFIETVGGPAWGLRVSVAIVPAF